MSQDELKGMKEHYCEMCVDKTRPVEIQKLQRSTVFDVINRLYEDNKL